MLMGTKVAGKSFGNEIRITLEGCDPDVLNSKNRLLQIIRNVCSALQVEIRAEVCHTFQPQGVSLIVILAESHCAIHTWPEDERRIAVVDIFTCGEVDPVSVVPQITRDLDAKSSNFTLAQRSVANTPAARTYPRYPEYILTSPPGGHFPKPVFRRGIGREYLMDPEGLSWSQFFNSDLYRPPAGKDILLLHPCSWAKPYDFSNYISRLRKVTDSHDRVHRVIISNVGLVPFEYQMNEFFCSYDYMDVSEQNSANDDSRKIFQKLTAERISDYIFAHKNDYKAIVLLGHPVARGYHEAVSRAAREAEMIGFQVPRAQTYRAAAQETRGERDIDAPLFTNRSLEELSCGLSALEKKLDETSVDV